jgi:TPR repeat protein
MKTNAIIRKTSASVWSAEPPISGIAHKPPSMALACGIVFSLTLAFAEAGLCEDARLKATLAKASAGDAEAQYQLGRIYEFGEGIRPNAVSAVKWYRKAAEQELARAQYDLGRMYASGDGWSRIG